MEKKTNLLSIKLKLSYELVNLSIVKFSDELKTSCVYNLIRIVICYLYNIFNVTYLYFFL